MSKICIDGYNLAMPKGSGIATYGRNLLINLKAMGKSTQVLYGPPAGRNRDNVVNEASLADSDRQPRKLKRAARYGQTLCARFGYRPWPITPSGEVIWPERAGGRPAADSYWAVENLFNVANRAFSVYGTVTPVRFPRDSGLTPDVMQWTATLPMHAPGVPNIYTIHDLIPLRLPHTTADDKAKYARMCQFIARKADHISVVSETTRQDVIRLLNVSENRVTNTYQAVDLPERLVSRSDGEITTEIEGIFNLGWKSYFLHFGAIEPKKNLGRIVEAYLGSGVKTPLVIVGGRAWLDANETALLDQVKRDGGPNADRIRRYEYMPYSLLLSLIRGAKATIFPSLYEGFGLPILESMALGTAVMTSTAGASPEVSGKASLAVDPYDVAQMTRGFRTLDADLDLLDELVVSGRVQAAKFSSEAYRDRLQGVYDSVV